MSQNHTGNVQPAVDNEEHDHLPGGVAVKKVGNYVYDQTLRGGLGDWKRWDGSGTAASTFAFYGSTSDATYDYVGKQSAGGAWYIMRINKTTGVATYAVGTSDMATAWAAFATQDYDVYANHHPGA